jgi:glucose/arabinose dehydrogenase
VAFLAAACSSEGGPPPNTGDGPLPRIDGSVPPGPDATIDTGPAPSVDAPPLVEDAPPPVDDAGMVAKTFCSMGVDVPGTSVPGGFCLRRFAGVTEARTMAFAPNGDLFVGAPMQGTPGGASGGPGAIMVLSDDDRDGVAEISKFLEGVPDVHGITLGGGFLYFTTSNQIYRTPYETGQRRETGPRQDLGMPATFGMGGRWTHGLAMSVGGRLYATRGQYGTCGGNTGGEISVVSMGTSNVVAKGFRNPMYMRCHFKDDLCAATELGEDGQPGAKEKLVSMRPGADYGYPCCHGLNVPFGAGRNCGSVQQEEAAFVLSDTPFGFDWEHDKWPDPYKGAIFVALHGSFYTQPPWGGARIVFARVDPTTRMPTEGWRDFVGGFGYGGSILDRPSDVAFAPDGRMFFADDQGGGVYWVAPNSLTRPN